MKDRKNSLFYKEKSLVGLTPGVSNIEIEKESTFLQLNGINSNQLQNKLLLCLPL